MSLFGKKTWRLCSKKGLHKPFFSQQNLNASLSPSSPFSKGNSFILQLSRFLLSCITGSLSKPANAVLNEAQHHPLPKSTGTSTKTDWRKDPQRDHFICVLLHCPVCLAPEVERVLANSAVYRLSLSYSQDEACICRVTSFHPVLQRGCVAQ